MRVVPPPGGQLGDHGRDSTMSRDPQCRLERQTVLCVGSQRGERFVQPMACEVDRVVEHLSTCQVSTVLALAGCQVWQDEHVRGAAERDGAESVGEDGLARDRDDGGIEQALMHLAHEHGAVVDLPVDRDVGELDLRRREDDGCERLDRPEAEGACLGGRLDVGGEHLELGQESRGVPCQLTSGRCGASARRVALEQPSPETTLECCQAARRRRLGGQQLLRRSPHRSVPGDRLGEDQVIGSKAGRHAHSV